MSVGRVSWTGFLLRSWPTISEFGSRRLAHPEPGDGHEDGSGGGHEACVEHGGSVCFESLLGASVGLEQVACNGSAL